MSDAAFGPLGERDWVCTCRSAVLGPMSWDRLLASSLQFVARIEPLAVSERVWRDPGTVLPWRHMILTSPRCVFLSILLCAVSACGNSGQNASSKPVRTSYTLPADFEATDDDGQKVALSKLIGERIAVIDFWATWCKPCIKSLPTVDKLAAEVPSDRVAVIALNVGEKPEQVAEFRAELGLTLPIVFDVGMDLPERIGIKALPALIVVDAQGQVMHRGKTLDDAARAQLDSLLKTDP